MKSALRKDLESTIGSFIVKELVEPHFDPNWHFHPHYQLFLVEEGTGTRFIGDSIRPFGPGDLVMLGPDLPHLWRSDQPYFDPTSGLRTRGLVIYFTDDCLGADFFNHPEMVQLRRLLTDSRRGICWSGATHDQTADAMRTLQKQPANFRRVLSFLSLLDTLSHANDMEFITNANYVNPMKPADTDENSASTLAYRRMQAVHTYVLTHFHDTIKLEEVADVAGLTPSAFCRYFKTRTNKTFVDFVSEVRIGHACKLLTNSDLSISQICYESGFRTLSNFNRQFRTVTGQTPSQYVKSITNYT
ncbi:transcriptional regulator, AraC family [Fibrella aestuarina BUZ 2]|uniref:Transcriptional regulator, AraC family n=1 Tax=Fibrella aestuarina BUZ 2 TaxID=1166018 RepID=I0K6L7_9BACT|nr:AraC family transcriptional regulator [Fibrella aestuarina]CCG99770.1 transcriptional regulator, AraC family [Fibrella aestuarina BUZ 2]